MPEYKRSLLQSHMKKMMGEVFILKLVQERIDLMKIT